MAIRVCFNNFVIGTARQKCNLSSSAGDKANNHSKRCDTFICVRQKPHIVQSPYSSQHSVPDGASRASVWPLSSWLLTRFAPPMRVNRGREAPALMGLLADSERRGGRGSRLTGGGDSYALRGPQKEDRQAALSQGPQQMQPS